MTVSSAALANKHADIARVEENNDVNTTVHVGGCQRFTQERKLWFLPVETSFAVLQLLFSAFKLNVVMFLMLCLILSTWIVWWRHCSTAYTCQDDSVA